MTVTVKWNLGLRWSIEKEHEWINFNGTLPDDAHFKNIGFFLVPPLPDRLDTRLHVLRTTQEEKEVL